MNGEKYGFVYIWRDRKHNRYYVGSHWGTEDDGYICSSRIMRQAYRRRPDDFKRRIVERNYIERNQLYEAENRWLKLAEKNKDRHYNMRFDTTHWTAYPEKVKSIREKISHRTKEAMARPEVKAKVDAHYDNMRGKTQPAHLVEKRRQSMIDTMAEKFPIENRWKKLSDDERTEYYSQKGKDIWANRTEEEKIEVGKKISNALKGKQIRLGHTNTEEHRRRISEAQKGFIHPRHRISVDGIEYASTKKAAESLKISSATLCRRLLSEDYPNYQRMA